MNDPTELASLKFNEALPLVRADLNAFMDALDRMASET